MIILILMCILFSLNFFVASRGITYFPGSKGSWRPYWVVEILWSGQSFPWVRPCGTLIFFIMYDFSESGSTILSLLFSAIINFKRLEYYACCVDLKLPLCLLHVYLFETMSLLSSSTFYFFTLFQFHSLLFQYIYMACYACKHYFPLWWVFRCIIFAIVHHLLDFRGFGLILILWRSLPKC